MTDVLTCGNCGCTDDTVEVVNDPYALEMSGRRVEMVLCSECYTGRVQDV